MKNKKTIASMALPLGDKKAPDIVSKAMSGAMKVGLTGIMGDTSYARLGKKKK